MPYKVEQMQKSRHTKHGLVTRFKTHRFKTRKKALAFATSHVHCTHPTYVQKKRKR